MSDTKTSYEYTTMTTQACHQDQPSSTIDYTNNAADFDKRADRKQALSNAKQQIASFLNVVNAKISMLIMQNQRILDRIESEKTDKKNSAFIQELNNQIKQIDNELKSLYEIKYQLPSADSQRQSIQFLTNSFKSLNIEFATLSQFANQQRREIQEMLDASEYRAQEIFTRSQEFAATVSQLDQLNKTKALLIQKLNYHMSRLLTLDKEEEKR